MAKKIHRRFVDGLLIEWAQWHDKISHHGGLGFNSKSIEGRLSEIGVRIETNYREIIPDVQSSGYTRIIDKAFSKMPLEFKQAVYFKYLFYSDDLNKAVPDKIKAYEYSQALKKSTRHFEATVDSVRDYVLGFVDSYTIFSNGTTRV